MIKSLVISSIFLFGFFLIFAVAFRLAFGKGFIKKHFNKFYVIVFAVVALGGLFTIAHISSKNSGIYAWDSGGYWVWSYKHTNELYSSPNEAMQSLQQSIIESDYNLILPTIISLPLKVLGNTFLRYACINYILFFVPALFILLCIFMKITEKDKAKNRNFMVGILAIVSLSVPLISILQGYIDVAIMIPITLIFALTLSYDPLKPLNKQQVLKSLMIGLLLTITFLFRRYTAFFVVGYGITMVAYTAFMLIIAKKKELKSLIKNALLNALLVAAPLLVILLGFFSGLIFRILGENYAELYSAYSDPLLQKILIVIWHFGIVILAVALFGLIESFRRKKNQMISFFCVFSIIIIAVLFFRVQSMNGHHIYTITPQIYIMLFLGLMYLFSVKKKIALKVIVVIILLVDSLACLSSRVFGIVGPVAPMFQKHYTNVLHREDIETIRELRDYLNELNSDGKSIIYVLSSSVTFNSDTLMVMERPAKDNAVTGLVKSHDVDLRDGFPNIFFDADIIVTTKPIGTHLIEGSQEIITYLAEKVQDENSYLGRHYKKDPKEFQIMEGFTVYVYQKTSDLTAQDYDRMIEYYDSLYPEQKTIFKDRLEQAKEAAFSKS